MKKIYETPAFLYVALETEDDILLVSQQSDGTEEGLITEGDEGTSSEH